jgi:hypothetical protein
MAAHQHHKFLTPKAVQAVLNAEVDAHQARHQQQDLVPNQVAKVVVHPFEVVNVNHCEPVAVGNTAASAVKADATLVAVELNGGLEESVVKGLAIEQFCQRIFFTVVQQTLQVLVNLQNACHRVQGFTGQAARRQQFQHTHGSLGGRTIGQHRGIRADPDFVDLPG